MTGADLTRKGLFVYDDSSLAPAGYEDAVRRPAWPVLNVRDFGAKGDDAADDTPAVRAALAAAPASGAIIYFPAGVYRLMPQPGDAPAHTPPCLRLGRGKLVLQGEGPGASTLRFRCAGNADPLTGWAVVGDGTGYQKISRGNLIRFDWNDASPRGPLSGLQLRSLTLDGGCPYTGNSTVGGDPLTGDGWDESHKALLCNGPVGGVLVHCCEVVNWRGEALYAGGGGGSWLVTNSQVRGCNASAVSCSADFTAVQSTVGPDVYNGAENFAFQAGQGNTLKDCLIQCSTDPAHPHGNGAAMLGIPGTVATVTGCLFAGCGKAVLLSEVAHDFTFRDNTLRGNGGGVITSILGLYPAFPRGFDNLTLDGNTADASGVFLNMQSHGPGPVNVTVSNNALTTSGQLAAGNWGTAHPAGFLFDNNALGPGCKDVSGTWNGVRGVWSGTARPPGTGTMPSVNDYGAASVQTTVAPVSDALCLNDVANHAVPHYAVMDPATLPLYPAGFTTTFYQGPAKRAWLLKADPAWNTLPADVPVPAAGVTLVYDGKLFNPK